MSARTIFCRFCGVGGAHRHGVDARRRMRYKCPHCERTFTGRTNTMKSGSHLSDDDWRSVIRCFSLRGGMCGADIARFLGKNPKTGQKYNRALRALVTSLIPLQLPGASEWDESTALRFQWVLGGVSRLSHQCMLRCIDNRSEGTLVPIVEQYTDGESPVMTDEWLGYISLINRWSVCHSREFVGLMGNFGG